MQHSYRSLSFGWLDLTSRTFLVNINKLTGIENSICQNWHLFAFDSQIFGANDKPYKTNFHIFKKLISNNAEIKKVADSCKSNISSHFYTKVLSSDIKDTECEQPALCNVIK